MPGRGPIVPGERADGSQQRLRYGLGEFRPYRWHGIKDWNPAAVLGGRRDKHRKTRPCEKCGVQPGEQCLNRAGQPMRSYHTGR